MRSKVPPNTRPVKSGPPAELCGITPANDNDGGRTANPDAALRKEAETLAAALLGAPSGVRSAFLECAAQVRALLAWCEPSAFPDVRRDLSVLNDARDMYIDLARQALAGRREGR